MGSGYCYGCMEQITAYPCPRCGYSPTNAIAPYILRPGTILKGKYLIGRVLGQGGFGITYIGLDLQLQRKVAIKEYYPSGYAGRKGGTCNVVWYAGEAAQEARRSGQELVLKEARKMSKVSDIASVVKVFDVFQENGTAYICMDYIEGRTLLDWLKMTGPLPWEQAQAIFLPVIAAMEQVHQQGLIHRDLSPDNLMIQADGTVKILDLGAAKDMDVNSGKSSMQVAKNGFSPMEQYIHTGGSGSWTDVYSMAATMYYTLTGMLPPSAIDRLDGDTIRWDLPQLQVLPGEVRSAMMHAMAVRAGDRTQTMAAFLKELQGQASYNGEKKKPEQQKEKKKWKTPAIIAAAAVAAVAAVVIGIAAGSGSGSNSGSGSGSGSGSPAKANVQKQVEKLTESCTMEAYHYRNGAKMELYFNDQDKESLRIFTNEEGKDEYIFIAEYNEDGLLMEENSYEGETLAYRNVWFRNEAGKVTKILHYKENDVPDGKTQVTYDDNNREISRVDTDGNGNITMQASSTYDAQGNETCTYVYEDGSSYVAVYSSGGKILEGTSLDRNGNQTYRTEYLYDEAGKRTESISYDDGGQLSSRSEYHYRGDLEIGYTNHSYYDGNESIYEYEYIFGPRDIQFGQTYENGESNRYTEYVESIAYGSTIRIYEHMKYEYLSTVYEVTYYNWNGDIVNTDGFDEEGALVEHSETLFDEFGKRIGMENYEYNSDGSYSVYMWDEYYTTIYRKEYASDGRMTVNLEYHHDADGNQTGYTQWEYNEDGSYTQTEVDDQYHTTGIWTYDNTETLISSVEYSYDGNGNRSGSTAITYYYDGSYTVTVKDGKYRLVSENTYDANGKLIN